MNIALIGYGRMGKEIEQIALERNHKISLIIDKTNQESLNQTQLESVDVCIEFSTPETVLSNILRCFEAKKPVVSGTTGWLNQLNLITEKCRKQENGFFYASNFSLGVNIFFKLNRFLSKIMNDFDEYNLSLSETHHIKKIDAPSGTAITLLEDQLENIRRYKSWTLGKQKNKDEISVSAHRIPEIPGIHEIKFESSTDLIELKHEAKSRKGFALGAVLAAEFMQNKKGYYTMDDLLKFN